MQMNDLDYIDKYFDDVVKNAPNYQLDQMARMPASVESRSETPQQLTPPANPKAEADNSELWTNVITSFAPAVLGMATGEAGALVAPGVQKQALERQDQIRKEQAAKAERDRERARQQMEWDSKQKELRDNRAQKDLDNMRADKDQARKDRDAERADETLDLRRQELEAKKAEGKTAAKDPVLKAATELRKEFNSRPEIKRFSEVSTAFDKVQQAAENPSAAGDLSLIFGYMKMLDPGSTVREGEFANAQNAGGIPDRVVNMYNKAKNGERLNPEQRQQFIASAKQAYDAELAARQRVESEFGGLAGKYTVDPNLVYSAAKAKELKSAPAQDPQIANYAKQYGLSYEKAQSIINKRRGL